MKKLLFSVLISISTLVSWAQCNPSMNITVDPNTCAVAVNVGNTSWSSYYGGTIDFGDGQQQPLAGNVFHGYAANGTYTITLDLIGNVCNDTTLTQQVTISCVTPGNPCINPFIQTPITCDSVLFYADPVSSTANYFWYSPGTNWQYWTGDTIDLMFYSDTNAVIMTIIDSINNCSYTSSQQVITGNCPCSTTGDMVLTYDTTGNCQVTIDTANVGGGSGTYYYSVTAPGATMLGFYPHIASYSSGGFYPIDLYINDSQGCDTLITDTIFMNCPLVCDGSFSSNYISCDQISFTPNANNPSSIYTWDLGPNGVAYGYNIPNQTFTSNGSYNISLIVEDTITGCIDSTSQNVVINCGTTACGTMGGFLDTNNCTYNFTIDFGNADTLYVTYGDGNSDYFYASNGLIQFGSYTYPNNGVFNIYGYFTGLNCWDLFNDAVNINCGTTQNCSSTFSGYLDTNTCSYNYTFDLNSADTLYLYYGDGNYDFFNVSNGNTQSGSYTYQSNGTYLINAYFSSLLCDTAVYDTVAINCSTPLPCNGTLSSYFNSTNCTYYYNIDFDGTDTLLLDFGDGNSVYYYASNGQYQSGTYAYTSNGIFTVTANFNSTFCSNTVSDSVLVNCFANPCNSNFSGSLDSNTCVYNFSFDMNSADTLIIFYGDGNSDLFLAINGNSQTNTYTYQYNGNYLVQIYFSSQNCNGTFYDSVYVNCQVPNPCDASFIQQPITCDSIQFYPVTACNSCSYTWTSNGGTYPYWYSDTADYMFYQDTSQVTLTVVDSISGCTATSTQDVIINCPCNIYGDISAMLIDTTNCQYELSLNYINGGSGTYYTNWNFPGASLVGVNPYTISYPADSSYIIIANIIDSQGCTATLYDTIDVWCDSLVPIVINVGTVTAVPANVAGLMDENEINYKLYPNPTNGIFTIELEGKFEYTIFDPSGKIIVYNIAFDQEQLDLFALSDGIYIIQIRQDEHFIREKIVKN